MLANVLNPSTLTILFAYAVPYFAEIVFIIVWAFDILSGVNEFCVFGGWEYGTEYGTILLVTERPIVFGPAEFDNPLLTPWVTLIAPLVLLDPPPVENVSIKNFLSDLDRDFSTHILKLFIDPVDIYLISFPNLIFNLNGYKI
jgi:hypothetical protein